ncbi:FimD/PapC N-terminal domain-containing protein [Caballeronia sp. LZ028]|nr:FimD/PapC N-terminal domain-containing protein [Caballeronia sp. ATUFL_F2_KS42]MDR5767845.1 FimD/PapC N-terminal domain-containing protein [Caballeronia sp. LZ028]
MSASSHAYADAAKKYSAVEFNEQFLESGSGEKVDISRFNKGQEILPGTYRADTYVNNEWKGKLGIEIRGPQNGDGVVRPCMTSDLLTQFGVDIRKLTPEALAALDDADKTCPSLADLIPSQAFSFLAR